MTAYAWIAEERGIATATLSKASDTVPLSRTRKVLFTLSPRPSVVLMKFISSGTSLSVTTSPNSLAERLPSLMLRVLAGVITPGAGTNENPVT